MASLLWVLISFPVHGQTLPSIDASKLPPHPRLLLTDKAIKNAIEAAKTDPLRDQLHQRIIATAWQLLGEPPIQYNFGGSDMLGQSQRAIRTVLTCAAAYRLTGESHFSDRAIQEMLAAAAFPDWNPNHFLDVAEMSMALALGYDWLYPQLTPDQRAVIKKALLEKSLVFAKAAYGPDVTSDRRVWFATVTYNWNQVCNSGLLAAALAIAEDEPPLATFVVNGMRANIAGAMGVYQPDGSYPAGPTYWNYGTSYSVLAIAMLEDVFGTDLGLSEGGGFDHTDLYRLYVQSPSGQAFNYADGGSGILTVSPFYAMLALRSHRAFEIADCRKLLADKIGADSFVQDRFFALNLLWFPPAQTGPAAAPPLDAHFRGQADLAFFRSAWDSSDALFVGFKAGNDRANHTHLDLGSFVLDSDGVRWAEDLGAADYSLPRYFSMLPDSPRWTYFRVNNASHNTLTPGNLTQAAATAPIVSFESTPQRAFAIADLTPAYPSAAASLRRGIALLDRTRVLVQDEAVGLKPNTPLCWNLTTAAAIQLDPDRRGATLSQKGKTLRVKVLSPADGEFSVRSADPPLTSPESHNFGVSRLTFDCTPKTADARIAIVLIPTGPHWPAVTTDDAVTPLAKWKIDKK